MAKQPSLFFPVGVNNLSVTLTSADTTTPKLCFTANATNGSDVKSIIASTTDTATVNLTLWVTRSAVDYLLGTVNLPLLAGSNGSAPSVDLLASGLIPGLPLDAAGKQYLPLAAGDTLKVGCVATMTGAKTTYVSVFGQDY